MSIRSIIVIAVIVLFGVTACGKKGNVKPPQKVEFFSQKIEFGSQNGEFFAQNAQLES